jgi:hypothetical protein
MPFWTGIVFGGLISFVIICYRVPDPPCPRLRWKCLIVAIIGAIGATLYYWLMKFPNPITSIDFIGGGFAAFALSGTVHRIICPITKR